MNFVIGMQKSYIVQCKWFPLKWFWAKKKHSSAIFCDAFKRESKMNKPNEKTGQNKKAVAWIKERGVMTKPLARWPVLTFSLIQ